jgi:hypothetical protein
VLIAITPTACPASFKIGEPDMPGAVKLIDNPVPHMCENLCKRILTQLRSNVSAQPFLDSHELNAQRARPVDQGIIGCGFFVPLLAVGAAKNSDVRYRIHEQTFARDCVLAADGSQQVSYVRSSVYEDASAGGWRGKQCAAVTMILRL